MEKFEEQFSDLDVRTTVWMHYFYSSLITTGKNSEWPKLTKKTSLDSLSICYPEYGTAIGCYMRLKFIYEKMTKTYFTVLGLGKKLVHLMQMRHKS